MGIRCLLTWTTIHTYWDIAEASAIKLLGTTLVEARVPASAISLRWPAEQSSAKTADCISLASAIDRVLGGATLLLEIDKPRAGATEVQAG